MLLELSTTPNKAHGTCPRIRRRFDEKKPNSGYYIARMRFEIFMSPEAVEDVKRLKASHRSEVLDALESHLRHEPMKVSRSRIKRLRGPGRPQYRLRGGELRVFYDVSDSKVEVLAIVAKSEADSWLEQSGKPQ